MFTEKELETIHSSLIMKRNWLKNELEKIQTDKRRRGHNKAIDVSVYEENIKRITKTIDKTKKLLWPDEVSK